MNRYPVWKYIIIGIAIAIEFMGPLTIALMHARRVIHFVWIGCAIAGTAPLQPRPLRPSTMAAVATAG